MRRVARTPLSIDERQLIQLTVVRMTKITTHSSRCHKITISSSISPLGITTNEFWWAVFCRIETSSLQTSIINSCVFWRIFHSNLSSVLFVCALFRLICKQISHRMTTLRPFTCNDMFKFNNVYVKSCDFGNIPIQSKLMLMCFFFEIFFQQFRSIDWNLWIILLYAIFSSLARIFSSRWISQRWNYGI